MDNSRRPSECVTWISRGRVRPPSFPKVVVSRSATTSSRFFNRPLRAVSRSTTAVNSTSAPLSLALACSHLDEDMSADMQSTLPLAYDTSTDLSPDCDPSSLPGLTTSTETSFPSLSLRSRRVGARGSRSSLCGFPRFSVILTRRALCAFLPSCTAIYVCLCGCRGFVLLQYIEHGGAAR